MPHSFLHGARSFVTRLLLLVLLVVSALALGVWSPAQSAHAARQCRGRQDFTSLHANPKAASALAAFQARRAQANKQSAHVPSAVNALGNPGDENWSDAFGDDTDNPVFSFAFDADGNLYVGGCFNTIDGFSANHVAMWDGAQWHTLGFGFGEEDSVLAMAFDSNGNLYAGGDILAICDDAACSTTTPVNSLAMWDGTQWSPVAFGVNAPVAALALDASGLLYVGGFFNGVCQDADCLGADDAAYLATWDGTTLSPFAIGFDGPVFALQFDHPGNLYAGGLFLSSCEVAGCTTPTELNFVGMWDGDNWTPLSFGLDLYVSAIAVDSQNQVYVGGAFQTACSDESCCGCDGIELYGIGRWDGAAWHELGGGMEYFVNALAIDSADNVYPGGLFLGAYNDPEGTEFVDAPYIAKWDGTAWNGLGSGIGPAGDTEDSEVYALAYSGNGQGNTGNLFVGGYFSTAGDNDSVNVAQWTAANGQVIDGPGTYEFYTNNLPITIQVVSADELERINIQRYNKSHPDGGTTFDNGYFWVIEGFGAKGGPPVNFVVNLTLPTTYIPTTASKVCRYEGAGTWNCDASSFTSDSITRDGVTGFSPWATGAAVPTAANLEGLRARVREHKITLKWRTSTESQIAGFDLWRKKGKGSWEQINPDFMQAKQSGSVMGQNYRFPDKQVAAGHKYRYKLKVYYLDNHSEWSDVLKVKLPR